MLSYHPAKFSGHRYRDKGDVLLVVEGQNSTCPLLNPTLLSISKVYGMPCLHTQNYKM